MSDNFLVTALEIDFRTQTLILRDPVSIECKDGRFTQYQSRVQAPVTGKAISTPMSAYCDNQQKI
jgi:hypothetical protein